MKIIQFPEQRFQTLQDRLEDIINEYGCGLPVPAVIGVLEIIKKRIFQNQDAIHAADDD